MDFNFHTRRHRKVPGLSTTATADISFILLAFFLMVTSMDPVKGVQRLMPKEEQAEVEKFSEIDKRNVLAITLAADGRLFCNDEEKPERNIRQRVVSFLQHCPQTSKHVLLLDISGDAAYEPFFTLQNNLLLAYRQTRDAYARKKYGAPYDNLNDLQRAKVKSIYPQRISEKPKHE